jgi:hypothetical protein
MKYWSMALLVLFFLASASVVQAQKNNKDNKTDKGNKTQKDDKGGKDKDGKKTDPKAKDNTKKAGPVNINIEGLSREEKNTMTRCPLHGKHMNLSDNYRANASDFQESQEYPFAKQLQYRRFCGTCTKVMKAEHRKFEQENRRNADKPSFERCVVHNESMFVNGEYSSVNYQREINPDIPHAQQYKFKFYCKTCTKLYKEVEKDKRKGEKGKK